MGKVIDFTTREILDTGEKAEDVDYQRMTFRIKDTSDAIAQYLEKLYKEGYKADKAIFVVPDPSGDRGAAVISIDGAMSYTTMSKNLGEAYKKIHKLAKSEVPNEPA